ncbi:MAG: hypothetical protein ABR497_08330 [Kiritimatiellia bacterium]|nr:hypothetical protein [Lentisphaerota bacterium]
MKNAGRGFMLMIVTMIPLILCGMAPKPQPRPPLLLVAPAQPAVLQATFDVMLLRPEITLYSYRPVQGDLPPLLYAWEYGDWVELDIESLCERMRLADPETRAVFVAVPPADTGQLPQSLLRGREDLEQLETESVADLLNGLDRWCRFKPREWEWLASRQRLRLIDANSPQREYNPYVIRRSELPLELDVFEPEPGELPPAVIDLPDGHDESDDAENHDG